MNDHLLSFGVLLAVRLKDGLFVGNAASSRDEEFIESNKITHIVNCAGAEVPNYFANRGVSYLTFQWKDALQTVILDPQDQNIDQIYNFLERAFSKGESVLIHSLFGICRSCVVACGFLMRKFRWSLDNSINVMSAIHPEMKIKPHFMRQLVGFALRNGQSEDIFVSDSSVAASMPLESENLLIRNTYLNSLPKDEPVPTPKSTASSRSRRGGIRWSEALTDVAPDSFAVGCTAGPTLSAPVAPIIKGGSGVLSLSAPSTVSSFSLAPPPPSSSTLPLSASSISSGLGGFVVSSLGPPSSHAQPAPMLSPSYSSAGHHSVSSSMPSMPAPMRPTPSSGPTVPSTTQNIVIFQSSTGAQTRTAAAAPPLSLSGLGGMTLSGFGSALPSPSSGVRPSAPAPTSSEYPGYFSASDLMIDISRARATPPTGPPTTAPPPTVTMSSGGTPGTSSLVRPGSAGRGLSPKGAPTTDPPKKVGGGAAPPARTLGKTPLRAKQSPTPHARRIGTSEPPEHHQPIGSSAVASARRISLDARTGLTKTLAPNPMDYLSGSDGVGAAKDPTSRLAASLTASAGSSLFSTSSVPTRASVTGISSGSARPPSPATRVHSTPTSTARTGSPLKTFTRPGGASVTTQSGPLYNNFVGGGSVSGISPAPGMKHDKRLSSSGYMGDGADMVATTTTSARPSTAVTRPTMGGINLEAAFDPSKTKSRPKSAPLTTGQKTVGGTRASASPGSATLAARSGGGTLLGDFAISSTGPGSPMRKKPTGTAASSTTPKTAKKNPSPAVQRPSAMDDENRLYKPTQSFLSKQVSKSAAPPPSGPPMGFSSFGLGRSYF